VCGNYCGLNRAYSWNGNKSYLNTSLNAFRMVEMFDVQVHGVNSADEQLNGISPNLGTETCDISDYTYSNEWLLRITGNGWWLAESWEWEVG
jgi:hypothetical protein